MLRNHKKIIAVIVILVLVAAGVAAYFVFFKNNDSNQPKKSNGPGSHKPIVKDPSEIKPGTKGPDIKSKTQLPASGPTNTPATPKAAN
jgi:flagellar basal body-associated protein FliL